MSKRQDRAIKRRALRAMPNMENDPIARGVGMIVVSFTQPIQVDAPCHYCGNLATTRDHIVPKGKRGTDAWWNLVPACEPCNRRKSDADTWCRCAFCSRAVFLFELGHMRPERSPRQAYMEPKPPRARKKSRRARRPQGPPEKGYLRKSKDPAEQAYLDMMKVQAKPLPEREWNPPLSPPHWERKLDSFDGSV